MVKIKEFIYKSRKIILKQEDCMQFLSGLETGSIDVLITDPAYSGMNNKLKLGSGRIVGNYIDKGTRNGKWFAEFKDTEINYRKFLEECRRVLNPTTGHIYIMFDSFSLLSLGHIIREFFDIKNIIIWDKINLGMGHYFRRRHELIIFATNGNNRKIKNRKFPDVWRFKRIHNAKYPTQKPVEVFQAMLNASAKSGYVVCDPFMGSASSAIAAMKNDCNFYGCDISKRAFDFSSARIASYIKKNIDTAQKSGSEILQESLFWK